MNQRRHITKTDLVKEAVRVLQEAGVSVVGEDTTEEQFEAYRNWSERRDLGIATSQELYERALLAIRRRSGNA